MKKLFSLLFIPVFMAVSMFGLNSPGVSAAVNPLKNSVQCGIDAGAGVDTGTANQACAPKSDAPKKLSQSISTVINILSALAGAAAVIMLIIGGFRYVASAGNDSAVKAAKDTIVWAIAGLIVVATAQIIVHFVLNNITK